MDKAQARFGDVVDGEFAHHGTPLERDGPIRIRGLGRQFDPARMPVAYRSSGLDLRSRPKVLRQLKE